MKLNKSILFAASLLGALSMNAQDHSYVIQANKPGVEIQPTMYGVFFEDINYAADGGIYAEMVENRSFEAPQQFQGWDIMGNATIHDTNPAFPRNPKYAALRYTGNRNMYTGLYNRGYFGMGFKEGAKYDFSVYARKADADSSSPAQIKVQIIDHYGNKLDDQTISITSGDWTKYTLTLTARKGESKGNLRILLQGEQGVDLDHVSLFPQDNWHGLRPDLVKDLADLNPGVMRFPGGCIVEGSTLETRYQWKNSIGPVENRPLNLNRWNNTYDTKFAPSYYQSYGLGFYEYFLLAEKIGAEPLPILSVGLACQFHNTSIDAHVPVDDLGPYVQDALDLIEFANGSVSSEWGAKRAEMGHPEPFNLKFIGIGNEQWGTIYPERLEVFVKAIRAKYPDIKIVGSAGPSGSGEEFSYLWKEMNRIGADLVDEHYYMSPTWFLSNAQRYDNYDRSWPKVFAGEYAAHVTGRGFGAESVEIAESVAPGLDNPEGSNGLDMMAIYSRPKKDANGPQGPGAGAPGAGGPGTPGVPGAPGAGPGAGAPGAGPAGEMPAMPKTPDNAPFYKNNFKAAISEAAFMTGLERNADVVYMATYAPLFANAEGYQWDPDLIWFDNLSSVRTPNYYVQQMYGTNKGTNVLSILEDGKKIVGEDGLYATACFDKETGDYIVKIVNTSTDAKKLSVTFKGIKSLDAGTVTTLSASDDAYNSLDNPSNVKPQESKVSADKNVLNVTIPARAFQVYRF